MRRPVARILFSAAGFFLLGGCHKPSAPSPSPSSSSPTQDEHAQKSISPPSAEDPLSQGLWWLYHLQYDRARAAFEGYAKTNPSEPAGFFYQTATDWWQLAQDFELNQPDIVQRFEKDSQQTIRVAEALEKSKNPTTVARGLLYEGGAWGLRGQARGCASSMGERLPRRQARPRQLKKGAHVGPSSRRRLFGLRNL